MAETTRGRTHGGDAPVQIRSDRGGSAFFSAGRSHVLWGVEDDQWQSIRGDRRMIDDYVRASRYINANCLAVHAPWALIEPEQDQYDFSAVGYYLDRVAASGLKCVLYFTSANYAAGAMDFAPAYIRRDDETYPKIQGDPRYFRTEPWQNRPSLPVCPSNPRLLEREAEAYRRLMAFVRDHDPARNVLAVQVGGETNFFMALQDRWMDTVEPSIRCECPWCRRAFEGFSGSGLAFMTRQFSNHIKNVLAAGAAQHDLPAYTCAAPKEYGKGQWRYAENLPYHKRNIGRPHYFVGPSIAETRSVESFTREMDHYTAANIPGNFLWASGIDTGHGTPGSPQEHGPVNSWPHLEMAPWFNIFHYGGLGAIYWDHPAVSITKPAQGRPVREKLRAMWAPLRAIAPVLCAVRGDPETRWWHYARRELSFPLAGCAVTVRQSGENYGFAFRGPDGALYLAATAYGDGETLFECAPAAGPGEYVLERGCFDGDGRWAKSEAFAPEVRGGAYRFAVGGDHDDAARCVYRVAPSGSPTD